MTFARGWDAGEIVPQLRALAAPAEGSCLQVWLLELEMDSSQPPVAPVAGGSDALFWPMHTCVRVVHMCVLRHTSTHI